MDIKNELLSPRSDAVFKSILTRPEARFALRDLIESLLDIKVNSVHINSNELPIDHDEQKQERFDVNCTVDTGEQIEIEMQSCAMPGDGAYNHHQNLRDRSVYYASKLHAGRPGKGVAYSEMVKSYQINFCAFTVFENEQSFLNHFTLRNENGTQLTDDINIIFIELTKLQKIVNKPVYEMTDKEMWAIFFAYGDRPEYQPLIKEIASVKEGIKMAENILYTVSSDPRERARAISREKFERDYESGMIMSRRMGRAEGIEEGKTEEQYHTICKLLNKGLSVNQVEQLLDVTEEKIHEAHEWEKSHPEESKTDQQHQEEAESFNLRR